MEENGISYVVLTALKKTLKTSVSLKQTISLGESCSKEKVFTMSSVEKEPGQSLYIVLGIEPQYFSVPT